MTAPLNTELNLANPDDVYEALINAHRGLSAEQSQLLNAKLILLLVNHIGDRGVINAALTKARAGITHAITSPSTAAPGGPAAP
jgi:Protein of unknown function (DUF2783)